MKTQNSNLKTQNYNSKFKALMLLALIFTFLTFNLREAKAQTVSDYIWNPPPLTATFSAQTADLRQKLTTEVDKMIQDRNSDGLYDHLAPFAFTRGIASQREYYFVNPAETLLTLSLIYPYVPSATQTKIRSFLASEITSYSPLEIDFCGTWGNAGCLQNGARRELAPVPNNFHADICWGNTVDNPSTSCNPPASISNLYSLWAYGYYLGEWSYINSHYTEIRNIYLNYRNNIIANNAANIRYFPHIGGLIGFARIARQYGDTASANEAANLATTALQAAGGSGFVTFQRNSEALVTNYNTTWQTSPHEYWSHYFTVPLFFYNFRADAGMNLSLIYMTLFPREIGQFLKDNSQTQVNNLVNQIEAFEPGWELTRSGQSTAGENAYHTQDVKWTMFKLHAYVLGDTQEQLRKYLDVPIGIGDLFYLQMLVATIEAPSAGGPTPTPTPAPIACTVTNATWNPTSTTEGSMVNLSVTGTGNCSGKQVTFEVRRNGLPLIGDIPAVTQPNPQTFASGSATLSTNWIAEHNPQIPLTDPDYYFNATVDGVTTKSSDPMLHVTVATGPPIATGDWPQLGHDAQKSSASPQTVDGPYRFYWRWIDVQLALRAQPVVSSNRLFIGGLNGTLYALQADYDAQGGPPNILWQRDLKDPSGKNNSPVRSGAGVDTTNNTVIVGTQHGIIYGLDIVSGIQKWTVKTEGAILAAPVIYNGTAYLGSTDGTFYSIRTSDGHLNWKHTIIDPIKGNVPILGSAALSTDGSKAFFVAENVKAYGLNTSDGSESWSTQLQGQSEADRWPVVSGDAVVFRTQSIQSMFYDGILQRSDGVLDQAGPWQGKTQDKTVWTNDWNNVRPQIVQHLTNTPTDQTLFILNANTGLSKGIAPVLFTYGNGGPPASPAVYNNGFYLPFRPRHGIQTDSAVGVHVATKYDSELGRMDPTTLDITNLTSPDTFRYQFRMTSDEPANITIAGNLLLVDSWERLGGIKLSSNTDGRLTPIALETDPSLPCQGGPGGDSNWAYFFDSCPAGRTGEGRTRIGAVVGAGRIFWMRPGQARTNGLGALGPVNGGRTTVKALPPSKPTPGPIPGPTTISPQTLAGYVWNEPALPTAISNDLRQRLEQEINKIVTSNKHLIPFYLDRGRRGFNSWPPDSSHPPKPVNLGGGGEGFWYSQSELIYTLSLVYPYLNSTLQTQLRSYLQAEMTRFPPLQALSWPADPWLYQGQAREWYPIYNRSSLVNGWPPPAPPIQTIYALWAYAKYTGDWNYTQSHWSEIKALFDAKKDNIDSYGEIPGPIGYARIAKHLLDNNQLPSGITPAQLTAEASAGEAAAVAAMQRGYSFGQWRDIANNLYKEALGVTTEPGQRGQVFFGLTPEVGQYLRDSNQAAVDYTIDAATNNFGNSMWYTTMAGLQAEGGETTYQSPEIGWSVFLTQAYVKGANQEQLKYWLDRPWGLGDMYYLQKLVATIEAPTPLSPTPTPVSCTIASASWSTASVVEGGNIVLNAAASGDCSGKQVNFEVRRNLNLQPDQATTNQPTPNPVSLTALGNNFTASASWTADTWVDNCPLNPLTGPCDTEYFFKVNVVGETNTIDSNPRLITVSRGVTGPAASATDWPQVQKDPQHTGYSSETLGTNFQIAWTHPFQPERVHPQVQAIIYNGKVFVGTENGNMYALNTLSNPGTKAWSFKAGGPIVNSVAADLGKVFFGALDGAVYALNSENGQQVWKSQLSIDGGFTVAPILADNKVLIGNQDGLFYALDPNSGSVIWRYDTSSAIYQTAAYHNQKVFFGAQDMSVYALNTSPANVNDPNSILSWKSARLRGMAFKDYWPVVTQGYVLIRPMADIYMPGIAPNFSFAENISWRDQWATTVAAGQASAVPDIVNAQNTIINSYQANPGNFTKNLFILNENTGREDVVVPHSSNQTHSGTTAPPCVDREGKLILPLFFIGSGWGRLDLTTSRFTDILYDRYDQAQNVIWNGGPSQYPAGFGNTDENNAISCTNNLILSRHVNDGGFGGAGWGGAFNLDTRRWTGFPRGWRNGEMNNNTQGGGTNPFAVSNGRIYDIVLNELVVRTTQ